MSIVHETKVVCAVCGKEHIFNVVFSTNQSGYMDLDTRPPLMKRDMLPYEIQMCDNCFYSDYSIEDAPQFDVSILSAPNYLAVANNHKIDKVAKAYLLAGHLQAFQGNYSDAGLSFLKAAWIFDDREEPDYAKRARAKSHKYLSIYVEDTADINLAVLTVDLQRRMCDFAGAIETANQLIGYGVDEFLEKILKLEIKLSQASDDSCHNVGEVQ